MKLAVQILLAICLIVAVNASIKKATTQEVKKVLSKTSVPAEVASRKTTAHAMPYNMPYVNTLHFRQAAPPTQVPEFDLREEASANLRAIPSTEIDRNSRFSTSIVFGLGGSDGYGF